MTVERLVALLEAYGARPERWPEAERAAAAALLEQSAEARAHRDAAAALDAVLARATTAEPSADLAARIFAGAPRARVVSLARASRPKHLRMVAGVVGLAAAASLALWLVRRPPQHATLGPDVVVQLDDFETPTDALLSALNLDADDSMPEFGCDDPELGCDDPDVAPPSPSSTGAGANEEMQA
jgi:hypothetical protein